MKKLNLFIFMLILPAIFQMSYLKAQSVTLSSSTTYPVLAGGPSCSGSSNCKNIISETNDGSSDSPHVAYIPVYNDGTNSTGGLSNHLYSLLWDGGDATEDIPVYDTNSATNSGNVSSRLTIKSDSSGKTYYLYAGVVNDTGDKYTIYDHNDTNYDYFTSISDPNGSDVYATINLNKLCTNTYLSANCPSLIGITATPSNSTEITLFYFLSTEQYYSDSPEAEISAHPGVFIKYKMSNKVYSTDKITLSNVDKGDLRVTANFSLEDITEPYSMVAYDKTAAWAAGGTWADATSSANTWTFLAEYKAPPGTGAMDIFPLVNTTDYYVTIAYVDKWQFATNFTPAVQQTPESITNFLEKEACYFISAGFKEDHYILDYFRSFRDDILLNFSLGRDFVNFYYRTAPYYAQKYIYPSKVLSFLVRFVSYLLYFFLSNLIVVIFSLSGLALFMVLRKKGRQKMTPW